MQDQTDRYGSAGRSTYQRTYWRRTEDPAAWWTWGLPLLGLLLLFLYGAFFTAPAIEADMQDRVAAKLAANNVDASSVAGDGQIVNISAKADAEAGPGIRGLAGITRCDTWAGPLQCPTEVNLTLAQPDVAAPQARHHDFEFALTDGSLVLRGEVPSSTVKQALLDKATARFANVSDQLVVSDEAATVAYTLAGDKALSLLGLFDRGNARWAQGEFSATGWVSPDNAADSRQVFNTPSDGVRLGGLVLNELQSETDCNDHFATLLAETSIRFQTSSAVIDASSQALLAQLAEIAKECPGRISIAGHTDNVGAEEPNRILSLARAEAVRNALAELGVSIARLDAVGYGESEPIASNSTAAGRAQNRRIAIRILESATDNTK